MAAAVPFLPMIIGAGAGALMNKKNPVLGAALGAVGGHFIGPMASSIFSAAPAAAASGATSAAASGGGALLSAGAPGIAPVMSASTPIMGMNQAANLFTTPFAKAIDAVAPYASRFGQAGSMMGNISKLTGIGANPQQISMPSPPPRIRVPIEPVPLFETTPKRRRGGIYG